ncbi:MAG: PLP-dependent transferase [Nitrospirae bacterium]|nr:PLP-dependent transferase [Nitrospirota bacterium]
MKKKRYGFGTEAVHGGEEKGFLYNPASTPIYQTSTFFFSDMQEAAEVNQGRKEGFVYTRIGNPTIKAFEDKMAILEGGEAAQAFSSGMAAISAVLLEILRPGDEIISSSHIYGGARSFFDNILRKLDCPVRYFSPLEDLKKKIPALITKKTRLIFFETPSNPELSIIDLKLISGIARKHKIVSVIDNTFATPYLQRPLVSGIDCVIHSATKYIGGHGDAIGGVVAGSGDFIARLRKNMLLNLGACASPFNAWLFLRGLKTLHVRMEHHCRSAEKIADFLKRHPKVKGVLFPGLKDHPGHAVAKRQMSAFGGMVSFGLPGRSSCRRFIDNLHICRLGVSLGDTETIVLNSALMFHSEISDAACRRLGIEPTLIRISTGLEDPEDIIEDMKTALKAV